MICPNHKLQHNRLLDNKLQHSKLLGLGNKVLGLGNKLLHSKLLHNLSIAFPDCISKSQPLQTYC